MAKKVSFFIDSLGGGGAERVVSVLTNELIKRGYKIDILMLRKVEIPYKLSNQANLYYADDMPVTTKYGILVRKIFDIWSCFRKRFYIPFLRKLGNTTYPKWNETSFYFYAKYALPYREYLKKNKDCTAFGLLIRSNISLLQAAKGTKVRTVFCERNNPVRPDMPKNIIKIRDRLYLHCQAAIFQTEEERQYYTKLRCNTAVILNPIKENLPNRYTGERKHEIVNFCRLNKQKNIPLLIDAFELLHQDYPDYKLRIYGKGEEKEALIKYVIDKKLEAAVFFEDFATDIHERVADASIFAFTSDYEGLSNSMIEAMGIGLPCVCTDCAGGGAKMMIEDHINGILVPVGDVQAVYKGMKEIIEDRELANKLSKEALTIRERLSVSKIADQWEAMI